jgi:hypothetical protein
MLVKLSDSDLIFLGAAAILAPTVQPGKAWTEADESAAVTALRFSTL